MDDALYKCKSYIESGADGIMIHLSQEDGKEILDFCKNYQEFGLGYLIVVPSSFDQLPKVNLRKQE